MSTPTLTRRELPRFIQDQLAAPPPRSTGLHRWLFCMALKLHAYRTEEEINQLLADVPGVRDGEIADAVRNSKARARRPGALGQNKLASRWPAVHTALRAQVLKCGRGLGGLMEASPVNLTAGGLDPEVLIDQLFPGNPLLCCGASATRFDTKPRELWRGQMTKMQFIVPSPMSKPRGTTKEGKLSARCLDNTGPRRFLVVEFDQGSKDEHATILLHLSACHGQLAMVVYSGGKSLHGWFPCAGRSDGELRGFFAYAVALGADPATFSRCQQVRMPGGLRDTGAQQSVHYFNPGVLQ